jgi:hypothetical protein
MRKDYRARPQGGKWKLNETDRFRGGTASQQRYIGVGPQVVK